MPGRRGSLNDRILPGRYDARFVRVFAWYVRRLFRKRFFAVRLAAGSADVLHAAGEHTGPLVAAMNHGAWWDPLVAVLLGPLYFPRHTACAPMDRPQLEKFAMFKRLGVFGVDPDDPATLPAMVDYVTGLAAENPAVMLWITPQGRFTDCRDPIVVRPGAAAVLSRLHAPRLVSIAIEYAFWVDQRPEVFLRVIEPDPPPNPSSAGWQRVLSDAMTDNARELAALVRARNGDAFEAIIGRGAARINPVYDAWQRLRGVGSAVTPRDQGPEVSG